MKMDRTSRNDTNKIADIMNDEQDTKVVLSEETLHRVPSRALPHCQCEGERLIIARQYGGGEHLWLECSMCYQRGKQAIPKHLAHIKGKR